MKVVVRPGQCWEFTDPSGTTHRALVATVTAPIVGVRYVYLRQAGSRGPKRVPLRRLERQLEGARLGQDHDGTQPTETRRDRKVPKPTEAESAPRRQTLHAPTMSAEYRQEAIARARWLTAHGRTLGEIAHALSVLPEIVEGWLKESSTPK